MLKILNNQHQIINENLDRYFHFAKAHTNEGVEKKDLSDDENRQ